MPTRREILAALPAAGLAVAAAGCASADKTQASAAGTTTGGSSTGTMTGMSGMSGGQGGMSMSGGGGSGSVPEVNGIKAVATRKLASAEWQGMKIEAQTMTPSEFVIFNGTSERLVKPAKDDSFHLMVMLNDASTGVPIPYAGVWATILTASGKVVFDESQWPMLSAYMGPHYGNNVALPGSGEYRLKLLITPPKSARHMEYRDVWLKQHAVELAFRWPQ